MFCLTSFQKRFCAFLPSHGMDRRSSTAHAQYLVAGYTLNCPESGETVINDMKEIGPTYCTPRVWENLLTKL